MDGGVRSRFGRDLPLLDLDYVFCVRSLGSFSYREFDRLPLFEAFEAGTLNCGMMHEDIAARGALNESVTLGVVKPLHFSLFSFH